jgi:ribonucleotide reductase alpha subunit
LLKINGKIVERPQHMLMRVSVGIHLDDLKSVIETYDLMSKNSLPTLRQPYLMRVQKTSNVELFPIGDAR